LCVKALADGRHAGRVVDAEEPSRNIDLVRPVVADLARSPTREPVPVVVDDVVAIRRPRRGPLPEIVIEIRRHRRDLPVTDTAAGVGVPRAREIGRTDLTASHAVERLEEMRPGASLRA